MIRHAGLDTALPVSALTVAVVEPPLETLLMFAVGLTALLAPDFVAAVITAIAVAAITTAADVENSPAAIGNTESLPKNSFGLSSHPHLVADWTSGPLS